MIRNLLVYFILFFTFCNSHSCFSQFEGIVLYDMTYSSADPDTRSYITMLPKESVLYIKDTQTRFDQALTGGGFQSFITNSASNTSILLMRFMGQKFQVSLDGEEMQQLEKIQNLKIIEGTKTKEIYGYLCHQVFALSGNDSLEIYYTPDIKAPSILPQFSDLKGLPLQYEIINDHIRIKYSCNKIMAESIAKNVFEVDDDIQKIPFEQFAESFAVSKSPPVEDHLKLKP